MTSNQEIMAQYNKYFTPSIEDIKQRLIDDNTLGVTISEKLDLMLSFEHNVKDIIFKICKRINTSNQK